MKRPPYSVLPPALHSLPSTLELPFLPVSAFPPQRYCLLTYYRYFTSSPFCYHLPPHPHPTHTETQAPWEQDRVLCLDPSWHTVGIQQLPVR